MITVNGWCAGGKGGGQGKGGMSVQSMVEMGKNFCPNFLQPFLENIDRSWELIPIFHNPHRKCRPSPSAVARTLETLKGGLLTSMLSQRTHASSAPSWTITMHSSVWLLFKMARRFPSHRRKRKFYKVGSMENIWLRRSVPDFGYRHCYALYMKRSATLLQPWRVFTAPRHPESKDMVANDDALSKSCIDQSINSKQSTTERVL